MPFHRAELSLAGSLLRLLGDRADRLPHFVRRRLGQGPGMVAHPHRADLAPEQQQAVRIALTSKVAV